MKSLINLTKAIIFVAIFGIIMLWLSKVAGADPDYTDALGHAKDAFMIQSGAQKMQDGTLSYLRGTYVDQYAWTKDVGLVGAGGWYVYKHREIPIKLSSSAKLTIAQYSLGLEYKFK